MRTAKNVEGRSTVLLWTIIVFILVVAKVVWEHLAVVDHSTLTFLHVAVLRNPQTLNIIHYFGGIVDIGRSLLLEINSKVIDAAR